jgi:biopolymer transport protein ExbB
MTTISIITTVAPMLGILGTAWGLVDIFGVFGSPEADAEIAIGISKALYTTIFGLAIAVPGVIALACFERTLARRAALINEIFTDLLAQRNKL